MHKLCTILANALWLLFSASALANPLVIAHRGASGYLPENTLEATTLAFALGADYIEQDLVLTGDGELVVLHDIHLESTTDVEQKFPDRRRADGRYYVIDFTLAEIQTLDVHERQQANGELVFKNRYQSEGNFKVSTFREHIDLIDNLNRQFGQQVGIYPELKASDFHRDEGQDISRVFLAELRARGLDHPNARVFVQCFDAGEVKRLRQQLGLKAPLIQLIAHSQKELQTDAGLKGLEAVADGVGPSLSLILDREGGLTSFAKRLNATGLEIHPYTHRSDVYLSSNEAETQMFERLVNEAGITGIFTDFPDRAARLIEAVAR